MKKNILKSVLFLLILISSFTIKSQTYPDQFYHIYGADSLLIGAESVDKIVKSYDGVSLKLKEGEKEGSIIFKPVTLSAKFNRGLPSWNGSAPVGEGSGFKVEMRFLIDNLWSPWLTVGYWDKFIWIPYGATSFAYGKVSVDYVKLDKYTETFQYKVSFKRQSIDYKSPNLRQLSFSVSDSETVIDIDSIVNDNPDEFYIPTNFLYQYSIDDDIGGSICSPTSVAMILKSFDIEVDELAFAQRTYDTYWNLFGVWPRVVTHASEYGVKGAVTRYRTWSETYDILKQGGRIAMSVGPPLYSGHLMMLAGFDEVGTPIVHDPAQTNGEGHIYNKRSLSESWFNKGGISYTFFLDDEYTNIQDDANMVDGFIVYPNPATYNANIKFKLAKSQNVIITVFDIKGVQVAYLLNKMMKEGTHEVSWNIANNNIPNGIYIARLLTDNQVYTKKIVINNR